jgi:hypothetical protein
MANNTERGVLYLGKDTSTGENVIDSIVSAGLVDVRKLNKPTLVYSLYCKIML